MKRVSTARAKQLREYAKVKLAFLTEQEMCFVCGKWVPPILRELHHFYKRKGKLLTWVPGFRLAHSRCHVPVIHINETAARERGLLAPKECCDDFDRAVKHHNQKDTK